MINPNKQDYINAEIFKFVELLEFSTENSSYEISEGSIKLKNNIDLTDLLINTPTIICEKNGDNIISKKECINSNCLGFNEENYKKFHGFIKNIYKERRFKELISFQFLEQISFEFILNIKKSNKAETSFTNYLVNKIDSSVKEYCIYFKILHLEIENNFKIGNVLFSFVDENFFKNDDKEDLFHSYKVEVLVSYSVKAEKEKAKEIAFKKCSLAVDCLKLFFDTIPFPKVKTSFDIDSRTNENLENEIIIFDNEKVNGISIEKFRVPSHQRVNNDKLILFKRTGIDYFHHFLLTIDEKNELTELELLIRNSIQHFAFSITIRNLNRRIVELFTLIESLILQDSNSPILESLTKYLSKILTKDINERKEIIKLIKEMYIIRSSYVHHALNKDFDTMKLGKFQVMIHMLIVKLIILSKSHQTKKTILNEIDEAILGAY